MIRNELTDLEQAEALARRKEPYKAKYPEAKHGTAGAVAISKSQGRKIDASERVSFANDTAAKAGLNQRTIQAGSIEASLYRGSLVLCWDAKEAPR